MHDVIYLNSKLITGENIYFLKSRKVENVSMIWTDRYVMCN